MRQNNLIAITNVPQEIQRIEETCAKLEMRCILFPTLDAMMETDQELPQTHLILLSATQTLKSDEVAGMVQVIKQILPESRVMVLIDKRMDSENAKFIKKSGASLVLFAQAVFETCQLEYTFGQWVGGAFAPVKGSEFLVGTTVACTLYYLMPMNKKMVPFVPKNTVLDEKRAEKLRMAQEVYISRAESGLYQKYISENVDRSAAGLASRCRAQYLQFCQSYSDLVFLLIDESELASFEVGRSLYDLCKKLSADLLTTLSSVGDAWLIVNNSAISDFGKVERAPAIACYSGLLSLMADIGKPEEVMIASLLADIGLLDMSPKIYDKQRAQIPVENWSAEEIKVYQTHPIVSVNRCLGRKISLDESLKKIILNTHERKDQKGFPAKPLPAKIPFESLLIQFCELIDEATLVRMGEGKVSVETARKSLIEQEFASASRFSIDFLMQLKTGL